MIQNGQTAVIKTCYIPNNKLLDQHTSWWLFYYNNQPQDKASHPILISRSDRNQCRHFDGIINQIPAFLLFSIR